MYEPTLSSSSTSATSFDSHLTIEKNYNYCINFMATLALINYNVESIKQIKEKGGGLNEGTQKKKLGEEERVDNDNSINHR